MCLHSLLSLIPRILKRMVFPALSMPGLLLVLIPAPATWAQDPALITIGTVTGQLNDAGTFDPFTDYLGGRLPGREFQVQGYDSLRELTDAVRSRSLDFAFVSPAAYVELAQDNAPRLLATITQQSGDERSPWLAGAVFTREDRDDITTLGDARGKEVLALSEIALGGWLAAAREWTDQGLDVQEDFASLAFNFSYTAIIDAVCGGEADIGVIAANTLSRLRTRCNAGLKVLPAPASDQRIPYPVPVSTRLYPEVAFVSVGNLDEQFVHDLTLALLGMPAGSDAANAVNIAGFTPPLRYNEVEALMREMRVGPFRELGALSLSQILLDNIYPIALLVLLVIFLTSGGFMYALMVSRKLRRVENYRKQVFEGSHIAMVVVDAGTNTFFDMNRAAVRLYGYTNKAELIGKPLIELSSPVQDFDTTIEEAFKEIASRVFEEGGTTFNWRHVRPSGQEWIGRIHLMAFGLSDENLIQATVEDITEELDREQERRDLAQQLEFSQRMESIGRLAGGIAHDFNNLLTIINGYCEVLLADADDDNTTRVIRQISKAGIRASELTQQLLTFSRRQISRHVPLDLNTIITESTDMTRSLLGDDVQVRLELQDTPCRVMADPGQLHQVLINLVVNAKDAMIRGGVLTITTAFRDVSPLMAQSLKLQPGKYVEMTVSDTGIGMEDDILRHIFEPFFTTKEYSGTGLGLSTVYGIVQQSQGIIQVESVKGAGTTFRVLLPQTERDARDETANLAGVVPGDNTRQVLVVEDQDDVRHFICSVLEKANYHVLSADSAKEALALAATLSQPVDLLLTDVVMEGMSGGELAEIFRQRYPEVPVIFMSGYPEDEIARRGVRQGDMAFLAKPFSPGELLDKVTAVLRKSLPHQAPLSGNHAP